MTDALYLYGLVTQTQQQHLGNLGPDIKLLKYAELVAIYRQCHRSEFNHSESAVNLDRLNPRLLAQIDEHDRVTRAVVSTSPLFPAGFATLYSGTDALLSFMRTNHQAIADFLHASEGHGEWAIKGYIKREQARDYLCARESEQQQILEESPGQRYVRERQIALKIEKQLTPWLQKRAQEAIEQLSQVAADITRRPVPAAAPSDGECFGNWAFLLADDCIDRFKQTLEDINLREEECGIHFNCTGPWALYSFSQNVVIKN